MDGIEEEVSLRRQRVALEHQLATQRVAVHQRGVALYSALADYLEWRDQADQSFLKVGQSQRRLKQVVRRGRLQVVGLIFMGTLLLVGVGSMVTALALLVQDSRSAAALILMVVGWATMGVAMGADWVARRALALLDFRRR